MTRHTTRAAYGLRLVAASAVAVAVSSLSALPAHAAFSGTNVAFTPASTPLPSGYVADTGQGFDAARGYGWVGFHDQQPVDLTANTRYGWDAASGYTTLLQMQQKATDGTVTGGRWEYALPNGTYAVTVTAGDARKRSDGTYCCLDSVHRLTVEGVLAVADFVPTAAQPLATATVTVAVSDGRLTIDPVGGDNTKIDKVSIVASTGTPQQKTPEVVGVTPARSATGVLLNASVSLAVNMPIDAATLSTTTFVVTGPDGKVSGGYNSDAAGGTASFTPSKNLNSAATYTVSVTAGLKSSTGVAFAPFTSTFKTGTSTPPLASTAFSKLASTAVPKPDVVTIGPDDKLYVGTQSGRIYRFTRAADGTLSNAESITPFGNRVVTGLAFDPTSPTTLWVTNDYPYYTNAPRMSGHISRLTVPTGQPLSAATASDAIVGLPRSAHDHMTNGIAFGPDGRLYIAQGANTAYGAPDPYWGDRGESPLSASILVADVHNAAAFAAGHVLDVNTDPLATTEDTGSDAPAAYNPTAAGAPLSVYASGIRNPFTLLWSGSRLYAPVNESAAGGATPAGAGGTPPAESNLQAYTDYLTRIVAGGYYGHPNPAQGHTALNGGNPTGGVDPYEVTEYPVGTAPDPAWRAPDLAVGVHRSPDGALAYVNATAFNGALKGKLLLTEYSDGDDLVAVTMDSAGKPVSEAAIPDANNPGQALLFNNPLGVTSDPATGVVYVTEGLSESSSSAGQITVLKPALTAAAVPSALHVNFQPSSVTAPAGYTADTGAAYNGTAGWQTSAGAALDLTANTRVRHSSLSPDVQHDTQILMQAPAGSGNATPGQYVAALANGTYSVTVTVGDPTATNSVNEITAQPGTANAVVLVDHFTPTTGTYWQTQTRTVTVTSSKLVLSPTGGTNTKLDYVDAVPVSSGGASLSVTSADTTTLALPSPRLVFSKTQGAADPAARSFTFTNKGTSTLTVSGLAVGGTDATSFALASGQATSLSIAAGGSATVSVRFHPTAPTNCPNSASPTAIGASTRAATLAFSSNDSSKPTGSLDLAGINSCGAGGNAEPVLDQVLPTLGYSTVVDNASIDHRYIGPKRYLSGTDEIVAPYFKAANSAQPVTLTPIAHFGGANTQIYGRTGWYAQGAAMSATSTCNSSCKQLWNFPADPSSTTYNENQKLLPTPVGTTSFTPTGTFGLYSGDYSDVNFSDDSLNIAHWTDNSNVPTPHYLHDLRIYPAYSAGHVLIPNTYLVGIDITRIPDYKNNDYQDVVLLLRNATPALAAGPAPGTSTTLNLAAGGTVSTSCAVTGFDGVLPNTAGNQCVPGNLAFTTGGLSIKSTAGQLADNNQQNALYKVFDATRGAFTVTARVVGPVNQLTTNYQQIGAWFGPDQNNFVKVEAEHNGTGDPHLTMFYREKGTSGTVGSVALPAMTTASTLDLVIKGNTTVPDPLPYGDQYHVSGYPLDQLTVYYSLNGGALVQVGSIKMPADVTGWFSKAAKAGILDSNTGSTTAITAKFARFAVTAP